MDTRSKIISAGAAVDVAGQMKRDGRKLMVVAGYFDVVLAAHARDLQRVCNGTTGASLMVVLLPLSGSLLAERARAELVAGLGMVDYVVTVAGGSLDEFLRLLRADEVVLRQAADEEQTRVLMEHVHGRHSL